MSEQNVEIVKRMCEAYARADWEAAATPLDPDIEWDAQTHIDWPDTGVFRGRDGVLEFFRRFLGTWEDYHADFDEYVDLDPHVVVRVRDRGRGKGSGVEVEREFAQVWTVRAGKVVRFQAHDTVESALAAARAD